MSDLSFVTELREAMKPFRGRQRSPSLDWVEFDRLVELARVGATAAAAPAAVDPRAEAQRLADEWFAQQEWIAAATAQQRHEAREAARDFAYWLLRAQRGPQSVSAPPAVDGVTDADWLDDFVEQTKGPGGLRADEAERLRRIAARLRMQRSGLPPAEETRVLCGNCGRSYRKGAEEDQHGIGACANAGRQSSEGAE